MRDWIIWFVVALLADLAAASLRDWLRQHGKAALQQWLQGLRHD